MRSKADISQLNLLNLYTNALCVGTLISVLNS